MITNENRFGEFAYEKRIVAFFDILGWKRKIEAAEEDPHRLAELALMLHMLSIFEEGIVEAQDGALLSSFSDNVVVSIRYSEEYLSEIVMGLARVQLGFAIMGYLIRGSVTVGKLHHTKKAVFGPGLIRAYELEHREAEFPRILLDQTCEELVGLSSPLLAGEDGKVFIDPFQPEFAQELQENQRDITVAIAEVEKAQGVPLAIPAGVVMDGPLVMMQLMNRLSEQLVSPLHQHEWNKPAWLFDRLARRIGSQVRAKDLPRQAPAEPQ